MSTIIDLLGSTIIGGMLLIMALNLIDTTNTFFYGQNDDLIVQQNLTTITQILEYNLRKMGFAVPEKTTVIMTADSIELRFLGDADNDWAPDTVRFFLGPTSELTSTANPNDKFLYRTINSLPANGDIIGVVTHFNFAYLNQDGLTVDTSNPINFSAIKMIRITMLVESQDVFSADPDPNSWVFRRAFWQKTRLVSRNLRR